MDIATLIGIIAGLGMIGGGIFANAAAAGASTAVFISPPSFIIVFGGMIASVAVAFPLNDIMALGAAIGATFKGSGDKFGTYVDEAVDVAEVARKGTTELEGRLGTVKNFFFKDGLQMVVDGYSEDEISDILYTRIDYREVREKAQADLFKTMGTMAPGWGMGGTLFGLVFMLAGFGGEGGGTDALGAGMSAALITTFYGSVLANLFFLPMAAKVGSRIQFTSTIQALLVEGAKLIHQKKHPIIVREKLNSFIPPKEWKREG